MKYLPWFLFPAFLWAAEVVDVYDVFPAHGGECAQYGYCGALGRQPCGNPDVGSLSSSEECGPCINGFVELSSHSRVCRRMKPEDRLDGNEVVVDSFVPQKRASYGSQGPLYLTSAEDSKTLSSAANRHTITFLILIAMAVAGIILVGALGLAYHSYSKREVKASTRNRKVSYGFEGGDDNEDKELARKTQIYHYQHQKRMISSMENRKGGEGTNDLLIAGSGRHSAASMAAPGSDGGSSSLSISQNDDSSSVKGGVTAIGGPPGGTGDHVTALPNDVIEGTSHKSQAQMLRMRSQGSIGGGSPKSVRTSAAGGAKMHQHQSLDRGAAGVPRGGKGGVADDSEEELDPDFTVYECPGLAPSGEMEVKNPLFSNEEDNNMGVTDEEEEEEE